VTSERHIADFLGNVDLAEERAVRMVDLDGVLRARVDPAIAVDAKPVGDARRHIRELAAVGEPASAVHVEHEDAVIVGGFAAERCRCIGNVQQRLVG
jgi:hypothetical protein